MIGGRKTSQNRPRVSRVARSAPEAKQTCFEARATCDRNQVGLLHKVSVALVGGALVGHFGRSVGMMSVCIDTQFCPSKSIYRCQETKWRISGLLASVLVCLLLRSESLLPRLCRSSIRGFFRGTTYKLDRGDGKRTSIGCPGIR